MDPRHPHPSTETLVRLYRREIPLAEVEQQEIEHLDAVCPEWARIWQELLEWRRRRAAEVDLAAAAEKARLASREMKARLAGDRNVAEKEVERLLAVEDPEERAEMVQRAYKRYRTPAFIERMVGEARTWLRHDWRESLALLAIAEAQLPRISREIYGERLVELATLRVMAHQANTLRSAGELPEAEKRFRAIRERLRERSVDDAALLGELASLEASLRYDQRRLEEAEGLLEEAAGWFREVGDAVGLAKVLVKRGMGLYTEGEPEAAIAHFEEAAPLIDPEEDLELAIAPRHNLVFCLCDAGHFHEARESLQRCRPLYERLSLPVAPLWLAWADGRVAAGLGENLEALDRLRTARDGYVERGLEFDAALVDLDLARVHLARGETTEVKQIANRMARSFAARGVAREAAQAVLLLRKAALTEAVTLELIASTRRALLRFGGRPFRRSG